jgi:acyl carrier protein
MTTATRDDIEQAVTGYIGETLLRGSGANELTPEVNLFTSGIVDSMGAMKMVAWIESTYALKVPAVDLVPENLQSIRIIADYVAGLLNQ